MSVVNQTLKVEKIFIIDDNSKDSNLLKEKILYFKNKYKKIDFEYFKNKKNLGPGISRNIAWDKVKTDFIAFLDSDDIWHHDKLKRQLKIFDEFPELSAVSSAKNRINRNNFSGFVKLKQILFSNFIPLSTVLIKSNVKNRFSENHYAEDYSLWLDMICEGHNFYYMNNVLCSENKRCLNTHNLSKNIFKMTFFTQLTLFKLYKKKISFVLIILLSQMWELFKLFARILLKLF